MRLDDAWLATHDPDPEISDLRREVRAFLAYELAEGRFVPRANAWLEGHDPPFSRRLAERGWLGMTWPRQYGGHGRPGIHRFVVIEELLAAGAPVAAHWVADRQTGPSLLKHGTPAQCERFLPSIARGECFFAIGMSEHEAGSDLASVNTRAIPVVGGWSVTGTKVWTSHAQRSHFFVALCRTSPAERSRHAGLSQLIVDFRAPGVSVRPIRTLGGVEHFAEVSLDEVFVPDDMLIGKEGDGWGQVTSELAHERSGPERFLSSLRLLQSAASSASRPWSDWASVVLGTAAAELWSLHAMSQSIAQQLDTGSAPHVESAIVKDLGTEWEASAVEISRSLMDAPIAVPPRHLHDELAAEGTLGAPGFTLRGGTTEILRGIIAKEFVP